VLQRVVKVMFNPENVQNPASSKVTSFLPLLILGIVCTAFSAIGFGTFAKSGWFHDGPDYPTGWEGYDKWQFTGLVVFTFCTPLSFTFLFATSQHILQHLSGILRFAFALLFSTLLICLAFVFGLHLHVEGCMFVACLDTNVYQDNGRPAAAGKGWLSTVGWALLICFASIGIITLYREIGLYRKYSTATQFRFSASLNTYSSEFVPLPPAGKILRRGFILYFSIVFPVLLFWFFTTYLPNSFEYFMPEKIASFAAKKLTHDRNIQTWPHYIAIPEYPWAIFWTKSVKLSNYWRLKIFPSNMFFFLFLLLTPVFALLFRWLRLTKFVPGHIFVFLAIATLVIFWSFYWLHDHIYNGYWPGPSDHAIYYSEKFTRACGQIAVLFMSLLMFPTSRNSVLPWIFGVSWEAAISWHIWLGRFFLAAGLAHMVSAYVWFADCGNFPKDIMAVPMHLLTSIDNFTVPLISVVFWFTLFTMGILTLWHIRRHYFEIFYYSHHITYCVLIPVVLWHAAAGWEFLLPGVTLWFVDRMIRAYRSAKSVEITNYRVHDFHKAGEVLTLQCSVDMDYVSGQYCFINVPEVSLLQWHPFTLSGTGNLEFHIKNTGNWTSDVIKSAKQDSLSICVDGPYGLPLDFHPYSHIFLVAGGIGITPCKSIFETLFNHQDELIRLERVVLVWMARDYSIFKLLDNPNDPRFSVLLYDTGKDGDLEATTCRFGRPDLRELDEFRVCGDHSTLLFTCGPSGLRKDCSKLALEKKWDYHEETFEL